MYGGLGYGLDQPVPGFFDPPQQGYGLDQPVPGLFEPPQQGYAAQGMSSNQGAMTNLLPIQNSIPWTTEEVKALKLNRARDKKWQDIYRNFPRHEYLDGEREYDRLAWTESENEAISKLTPGSDWELAASSMIGRDAWEVRARHAFCDTTSRTGYDFTPEEDLAVRVSHALYHEYSDIADELTGRSYKSVTQHRQTKISKWSDRADEYLLQFDGEITAAVLRDTPELNGRLLEEVKARRFYLTDKQKRQRERAREKAEKREAAKQKAEQRKAGKRSHHKSHGSR